jgi:2-polyprenyl-3-methyl-5-hydroxy-6-metoxy-1,4-benzoquinol methylase
MNRSTYALGHSDREMERLSAQDRFIRSTTRQFFHEAGIGAGMRVLDVGSGAGDTAFLAADMVGAAGEVIGTDRVAAAVVVATRRAEAQGLRNVSFLEGDPGEMAFDRPFDAAVGRYVLLFQADPAAMVRKLAGKLRPGGVIAFHEPEWDNARSIPPAPTYDRCRQWIAQTFRQAGTPDTNMAVRLHRAFVDAGLPAPSMRMQTFVGGGENCADWLQAVAELVGSLLPAMEQMGVTTAAEADVATMAGRLRREVTAGGGVIIGRSEIGAWSHVQR